MAVCHRVKICFYLHTKYFSIWLCKRTIPLPDVLDFINNMCWQHLVRLMLSVLSSSNSPHLPTSAVGTANDLQCHFCCQWYKNAHNQINPHWRGFSSIPNYSTTLFLSLTSTGKIRSSINKTSISAFITLLVQHICLFDSSSSHRLMFMSGTGHQVTDPSPDHMWMTFQQHCEVWMGTI